MKKLQVGTDKFRCKPPFKCFVYGRVGQYVAKCTYKENHEKWKNYSKGNVKGRFDNKKSSYTHEDSEHSSNNEDVGFDQDCQFLMEFEEKCVDESGDVFMDALEENDICKEILLLKK